MEPEIGTDGSSESRRNPRVAGYRSRFGPQSSYRSGFVPGLEPNRPVFTVHTQTGGGLPVPVANTCHHCLALNSMIKSSHRKQHALSTPFTEYCIHRVLHYAKIYCLLHPHSPASLSRLYCTWFSTFPQLRVNELIDSQPPWRLPPELPPPDVPPSSIPSISLDHCLQVLLQKRSITASHFISKFTRSAPTIAHLQTSSITASSAFMSSFILSVQVHRQTCSISASKSISELTQAQYPSASQSQPRMHLQPLSITASKCIYEFPWSRCPRASPKLLDQGLPVHFQGLTAGIRRYSGNGGGLSDWEHIFGRPQSG